METATSRVNITLVKPNRNNVMQTISVPGWDAAAKPLMFVAAVERTAGGDNLIVDIARDKESVIRMAFEFETFATFVDYLNEVRLKLKEVV